MKRATPTRSPRPSLAPYPQHPIHAFLLRAAQRFPDKIGLVDARESIRFAELEQRSARIASALQQRGFGKGERIGLFAANSVSFVASFFGIARAGCVVVPITASYKAGELAYQLGDSGARAVFLDPGLTPHLHQARPQCPALELAVLLGASERAGAGAGTIGLDQLLAEGKKPMPGVAIDPRRDLACLPYSSGTTGLPKGVMLSHSNLCSNVYQFHTCLPEYPVVAEDVSLNHLPYTHIYGLNVQMVGCVAAACRQVILSRFEPVELLGRLEAERATLLFTVPPVLLFLLGHDQLGRTDLSSLKYINTGAAPLAPSLGAEFAERTGVVVKQGYGMTETSPVTHVDYATAPRLETVGPPVADTDQKVVDPESGAELPLGEHGELCVRGPQVMQGYWNQPEDTRRVLRDGWFHSGDIASIDAEGYVRILDRAKEMIKVRGFAVAPAEVEAALLRHPQVADCAVVGVDDPEWVEFPRAFVVRSAGATPAAEELIAFVATQLASFKAPREIRFVDKIPRSPAGKILRRVLRQT
ncbi:MAG TPA: AMP-binding protein [Acidobacteriota bacterium]